MDERTLSLHNSMIHVKNLHSHLQTWPRLLWWQWSKDTVIWLPTTYEVCQTPFICMKWICYDYAGDGRSQSYPTACPQWESHWKSYDPAHPFLCYVWYGVVAFWLPTTYKVCQTLSICIKWIWYEYEVDGRSIISYSMSPVRIPLKILRPSPPLSVLCMVWCCGILTAHHI